MAVYRYKQIGVTVSQINQLISPDYPVTLLSPPGPVGLIDVTVDASSNKADLDLAMLSYGWSYFATDPSSTIQQYLQGIFLAKGTVTLVGGSATVSAPTVLSTSLVNLTPQPGDAPLGVAQITSVTPGTGFTITSTNNSDVATIGWSFVQG